MSKKSKKEELLNSLKGCSLISIDGASYFGKVEKKEGVINITEAVECADNLSDTVAKWLKAQNLGQLEKLEVSGLGTTVTKPLTEDQETEIELIAIKAARAYTTALPELINSKF